MQGARIAAFHVSYRQRPGAAKLLVAEVRRKSYGRVGFAERNKSQGLQRAVTQISRALRTGGNLSEIISTIADDVSFETRMKIRDYTELLNLISIGYIMIAVVAPVMITILAAVTQLPVFGGGVAFTLILGVFTGVTLITGALVYVIKKAEPTG